LGRPGGSNSPLINAVVALALLVCSPAAWATLGGVPPGNSVQTSQPGSSGARKLLQRAVVASSGYTVHESTLPSGTTVQELARPDGTVFAVIWSGPTLPDLDALLGAHAAALDQHLAQRRLQARRGSPVALTSPQLVLHSGGRMRDFAGHAYAPSLVPAGIRIQDVLP
jgi:hypothetical protein